MFKPVSTCVIGCYCPIRLWLWLWLWLYICIVMAPESSLLLIAGHVEQTYRQLRCLAASTTSFHHVGSCIFPEMVTHHHLFCGGTKMYARKQQVKKRSPRYLCMFRLCACGDCGGYMLFPQEAGKKQHHAKLRERARIAREFITTGIYP